MPLTAQVLAVLEAMAKANIRPVEELTPDAARTQFLVMATARRKLVTPVSRTEDRTITANGRDIPIRLYWPQSGEVDRERLRPLPAIVYFHGGGHVIGNIETHDEVTRVYCSGAEALVVSVDYAKGPERRFPAAVEDARAALDWIHAEAGKLGVDPQRVAVAGDSAGGNLATLAAFHVRDSSLPPLVLQVLVYPVIDFSFDAASYKQYAEGYGLVSAKAMDWFRNHYLVRPEDARDWRASPIHAETFAGLAPAVVVTAEYDVLHDEGLAYSAALRAAGVPVEHHIYSGVIHGFFVMSPAVDEAGRAQRAAIDRLRDAFKT